MFQSAGILCTLFVLGTVFLECNARHNKAYEQIKDSSILCYECNSEYDPRCGDPFDPYTIGLVNCSMKRPLNHITFKPTLCRKTVQKVQGHVRVIRGCGYIPDDRDGKECLVRTGTHDVHVRYCSCKGNYCNTAAPSARPLLGVVLAAITRLIQTA